MNFKFVVLEEGLSCPSNVLAALRDILSSGQFRNGTQTFTIRTEVVIICTNVNPMEVASESTSAEALLQRFPLVFEVKWNTHNIEDFINLFGKQVNRMDTGNEALLAGMIVEAINKGQKISPRVALKAYRLVMGQRNMRNATTTNPDDFLVLQFMQPFKDSIKEFVATIEDRRREAIIAAGFNALCIKIRSIIKVLSKMKSDDYIQFFTTEKSVEPLLSEVQKYTVSDKLFAEKAALAMEVKDVISYLHNSGMEALNKVTSAIVAGPVVIEEPDVVSGDDEDSGIDDKNFTI